MKKQYLENLLDQWTADTGEDKDLWEEVRENSGLDDLAKSQLPEELHELCDDFFDLLWQATAEDDYTASIRATQYMETLHDPGYKCDPAIMESELPQSFKETLVINRVSLDDFMKVAEVYKKLSGIRELPELIQAWGAVLSDQL